MADKAISELLAANQVTPTDLFVLEQSGVAKKLTGQTLENWLLSFADGHGGIQSIVKHSTSGLKDTYRITFADSTTFDFVVTNGRNVNSVTKTGTSGLVDTYAIEYNDGTSDEFTVTNGAKGDKGDNTYTHIKFASQEPTEASHSFGDVPDKWIGFYWGSSAAAPTDWTQYKWYQFKGDKGDTGSPATLTSAVVEYQVGNSGTIIPSEAWTASVPPVAQGKYLWTRTTQNFNTGSPVVSYSVSRMGLDGAGSVVSVNNVSPNADGNVVLTAEDVSARPNTWLPSIADIGAAPAGYGLGGIGTLKSWNNVDSLTANGWYRFGESVTISGATFMNPYMRVDAWDSNLCTQTLYSMDTPTRTIKRAKSGGMWLPWEWDNPPLTTGVEYRTTERFVGKVVYCKTVSCGALVAAGNSKTVATGIASYNRIVRHAGFVRNSNGYYVSLPIVGEIQYHIVNDGNIYIVCKTDGTIYASSYITMYYTKD